MNSKDFIDLAFKHADVATKTMQFFVVASVALGGWVISSDALQDSDPLSLQRLAWGALYLCVGALTWHVHINVRKRIDACFRLAAKLAGDDLTSDRDFETVTRVPPRIGANLGLPLLILIVEVLILGFARDGLFVFPPA